ncbi:MAG: family N-acetyltransferase [Ferruginibacter sp.]|nr:family N-acetyltransferase [Ferruginibacter sp.]
MIFREALKTDIQQIQIVRNSVEENRLSNPELVSDTDCEEFLFMRGKGWVCVVEERVVGFSIVDMVERNIWALFIHPEFASKGIGKELHRFMMEWYFQQTKDTVWLGTAPGTRAEMFYRHMGWKEVGKHGEKEIKFEMSFEGYKAHLNS